jgi:hypothetical protein
MMIILLYIVTRCISSVCQTPERIALLFFGVDGAGLIDIPCRFRGSKQTERKTMKQLLKISAGPATALLALAYVAMATPAAAGPSEYCRQDVTSGMRSCSFETMEQCQAMSSGRGGTCYRDPLLVDTGNAYAYQPKHSVSKSAIRSKKAVEKQ